MSERYEFSNISSFGDVSTYGKLKQFPEDFKVDEQISFIPSGSGDHVYLNIQKESSNTEWVVEQLTTLTGLKPVDIGYAGLKDRHAITTQWFSLHMPNQAEPDWSDLPSQICVLTATRHNKKLRTGAIEKNTFTLRIREVIGDVDEIVQRLNIISKRGFPNYFGAQRFGHQGANLFKLAGMTNGRRRVSKTQRGLYISSGRSYLFNQILKERIKQENWNEAIEGDVLSLQGSRSIIAGEAINQTIIGRIEAHDIHPAAILWGRGDIKTSSAAHHIEQNIINQYPNLTDALQKTGVEIAYRAMRVSLSDLRWNVDNNELYLTFSLPSGAYATALLAEFIDLS